MVKAKEKSITSKKDSVDKVKKVKDKKMKKKELLELLRTSFADADEDNDSKPKSKKNKEAIKAFKNENETDKNHSNEFGGDELEKLLYKPMPKKDRKVKLDPRFEEIYTNPEYAGITKDTDERGALKLIERPKQKSKKKRQELTEQSEEESSESQQEADSEDEETDLEDELRQISEDEGDVWDELEPPKVEYLEEATRRLCLKHMQWDRVTPRDIYVLASCFMPANGTLSRVTIYPSEEGVAKLPQDERVGPSVIGDLDSLAENDGVTEWPGEGRGGGVPVEELEADLSQPKAKRLNMCRRYEIERLGFFYAILDFDSPETANAVYEAIDGNEYESSGCRIDLYFVEDSRQVDKHLCGLPDEPAWRAMISTWPESAERPADDIGRYAPPNFVNNALSHTHQFGLSWDETPTERKQWMESLAEVDDINDDWQEEHCPELSRYLAMSDSSDDEEEEERERKRQVIRSLLQEADKAEEKRKRRQQRGLRKGDDSDSESDSEEEENDKRESSEEEKEEEEEPMLESAEERMEEEEEEEKMETSGESEVEATFDDDKNFFKMVAQKKNENRKKKEKKSKTKDVTEEMSNEDLHFGPTKKVKKKKKRGDHKKKEEMKVNEEKEKVGKRKRKRLTKQQKAKEKMKEKERPVDPELSLLMSNFKRTTKTPKQSDSKAVAEDPRFASIFKDPEFAKDPGSLVRLSARL